MRMSLKEMLTARFSANAHQRRPLGGISDAHDKSHVLKAQDDAAGRSNQLFRHLVHSR